MKVTYEKKTQPITVSADRLLSDIPHLHNELEIIYVEKGNVLAYADLSCYPLSSGDIFLAFPNQLHYYKNCSIGKYYVVITSTDLIYGQKSQLTGYIPESNQLHAGSEAGAFITKLGKCFYEKRMTECVGYLNLFMGRIMPEFSLTPALSTDNSTLRRILDFCTQHYAENISLETLEDALHLNKYYISHFLNRKLSIGFNDYVNMLRVREACKMLTESDKKIADISEDVGFGTIRSFNRSFRQIMNITPLEYRNLDDRRA